MHQNCVGFDGNCGIQQILRGGHPGDHALHITTPLDLQAVRRVIMEITDIQFLVYQGFKLEIIHGYSR